MRPTDDVIMVRGQRGVSLTLAPQDTVTRRRFESSSERDGECCLEPALCVEIPRSARASEVWNSMYRSLENVVTDSLCHLG